MANCHACNGTGIVWSFEPFTGELVPDGSVVLSTMVWHYPAWKGR